MRDVGTCNRREAEREERKQSVNGSGQKEAAAARGSVVPSSQAEARESATVFGSRKLTKTGRRQDKEQFLHDCEICGQTARMCDKKSFHFLVWREQVARVSECNLKLGQWK